MDAWDALKTEAVEAANRNLQLMDGTTGPVKKILADNDLVFGVWQDASEPGGVGTMIIKGQRWLEALAAGARDAPEGTVRFPVKDRRVRWSAISCTCAEQAAACRSTLGDGGTD